MLGSHGIWARELRFGDQVEAVEAAAELEQLAFSTLWIPGGEGGNLLESVETMLDATQNAVVATGILNVWGHDPRDVAVTHAKLDVAYPERFVLGLGVGHAPLVDANSPGRYARPVDKMTAYLDSLDAHMPPGAKPHRLIAALAPRMVELAGRRTLGVHPYMTPIEHTRWTRETLGGDPVVATAVAVVLDSDLERARQRARLDLALYMTLPNYVRTWRRFGFDDTDMIDGGSDRLVDALYALGSADRCAERVREHLDAGASHVCLRVVTNELERLARAEWRQLAAALND